MSQSEARRSFSRRRILQAMAALSVVSVVSAACQSASPPATSGSSQSSAPTKAAAGAATAAPAANAAPSSGPVTVSFTSQGNKEQLQMFDNIFDSFEKRNPSIKIDRKYDTTLSWPKVINELRSGTASDVMRTNDDDVFLLTVSGVLTTLTDYFKADINRDEYYPLAWTTRAGPGGEISRGLVATAPIVLFYNVDLFKEAGVKAPTDWDNDNWTMDDFETALSKVTKKTGDRVDVYGWDAPSYWWQVGLWNEGVPWYNDDETKAIADTPEAESALTKYQKWNANGWCVPPGGTDTTQLFNSGLMAMMQTDTGFESSIKPSVNWDVGPVFKGSAKDQAFHSDRVFAIPQFSKVKDSAWQVMNWLYTLTDDGKDGGQYYFAQAHFGIPVNKKAATGPAWKSGSAKEPEHLIVYSQGVSKAWPQPDNPMGEAFQVIWRESQNLELGKETPKHFLTAAEDLLNKTITQTGWSKAEDVPGYRLKNIMEKAAVPTAAPK